ncbi:hypothetical protein AVEN_198287-1 [Araneus ventricosus]|uniref:Uncharacterized protein n=1 Tax=Araneus ventricosus TaxID=182803 RepID=A0A4Y2VMB4_ARAVE|nr:hypothetical protein AVEN_198287-1 [Araneus ventricosus]
MYFSGEDKELRKKQERILDRKRKEEERKRKAPAASTSAVYSITDSEDSVSQPSTDENFLDNEKERHGLIIRENYKEVIELALAVLDNPSEKIHWRAPGGICQAWWMTKLQYAFKIFLFREHQNVFRTTKKRTDAAPTICTVWCFIAKNELNLHCCRSSWK